MERCPRCGSLWLTAIAVNGGPSEFWKMCSNPSCNSWLNTYVPQPHQVAFHRDSHRFKGNFGGYGSGKTLTSREEIYKHLFLTPKGNTLIGANVMSQYEQTIKREIEADMPAAFVSSMNTVKNYMDLINDHRVLYRPYDDAEKLRSYNLSSFLIVEASEVKVQSFTQLKARLRNMSAATSPQAPPSEIWLSGIIESNPSAGWIKDDVISVSDIVHLHGEVVDRFERQEDMADPLISSHITSTSANKYLPEGFIEQNTKNKPIWWVNRYIYGSFLYAEGLVYPGYHKTIVEPYPIGKDWKRIVAYDYGLSDDSVFLLAAINPVTKKVVIYDEIRANNKNIEELAKMFYQFTRDIPVGGYLVPPIIDPKSASKRDYDKKTLEDHFLDFGIAFKPGHINLDARVFRLNTYIESGKLEIFNTCKALIAEISKYKFVADETLAAGYTGKPVDKDNHGINCAEWICMELPADPSKIMYGVYNKMGRDLMLAEEPERQVDYWALSDDRDEYVQTGAFGVQLWL